MAEISGKICWSRPVSSRSSKPLRGNLLDLRRVRSNRFESGLLNAESEAGRETYGAHHAEFVLREATHGLTDGANDPGFQVGLPADKVENLAVVVTHQEAVDGEVAALNILLRRLRINHAVRMA